MLSLCTHTHIPSVLKHMEEPKPPKNTAMLQTLYCIQITMTDISPGTLQVLTTRGKSPASSCLSLRSLLCAETGCSFSEEREQWLALGYVHPTKISEIFFLLKDRLIRDTHTDIYIHTCMLNNISERRKPHVEASLEDRLEPKPTNTLPSWHKHGEALLVTSLS